MGSSALYTLLRPIWIALIWLICHPIIYLFIMPVVTQSQTRLPSSSAILSSNINTHSTSSTVESLTVYPTSSHSTNSFDESLNGSSQPIISTSSSDERSESIELQTYSTNIPTSLEKCSKCPIESSHCYSTSDFIMLPSSSSSTTISNLLFSLYVLLHNRLLISWDTIYRNVNILYSQTQ